MTARIVFLDRDTIAPGVVIRSPAFPHEWINHPRTSPADVAERLAGATIAITNKTPIRADVIERLPDLRYIGVAATGTDIVDGAACKARGIVVSNVRGYAIRTVPEHVFALMLALRRNLVGYRDDVIDGEWQRAGQFSFFTHTIGDLGGARLGIVGSGAIGSAVARIAEGFGMEAVFAGRKGDPAPAAPRVPFAEMLATADVITLHCPLMAETANLMGDAEFAAMKPGAILINTSRGGLIDEAALVRAIEGGCLGGAGIDVLPAEPPPADHPFMALATRKNFILTPHVAWASAPAMQALADQLVENIEAFQTGAPRNRIA